MDLGIPGLPPLLSPPLPGQNELRPGHGTPLINFRTIPAILGQLASLTGIQATRGNDLRIFKIRFKYNLCKFYFTNRVVDAWNSLSNWIVMANSTNTFKHRLDTVHIGKTSYL